jgi:hypothetical protein
MHTYYSNLSTKIQILQKLIAWQLHSLSISQNKGRFKVFPKFQNPKIGGDQKHSCTENIKNSQILKIKNNPISENVKPMNLKSMSNKHTQHAYEHKFQATTMLSKGS